LEVAEAMVFDERHEMLQEAGHRFPSGPNPNE
jgi:hypothetical protein